MNPCPANPFWYDCDRLPCHDCPERVCEGGCGMMAASCECAQDQYDDYYCSDCHLPDCICDPTAEYPPPPDAWVGVEGA